MPVTVTYPGVYIQEIPSGSRAITGVATAVAAFVGRAPRGPADTPVEISSYADYVRIFGGIWRESGLGYAVRDYYDKFFWPYQKLPGPIYAIPGNHDWYDGLHGFMIQLCEADPDLRPPGAFSMRGHSVGGFGSVTSTKVIATIAVQVFG